MTGSNPQAQAAKVRIQVEIRLSGKSELRAIMKALMPDNVNFPKGLSMEIFSRDNTLVLELLSKIGTNTLLNTIDEVLEHISIARKVIRDA